MNALCNLNIHAIYSLDYYSLKYFAQKVIKSDLHNQRDNLARTVIQIRQGSPLNYSTSTLCISRNTSNEMINILKKTNARDQKNAFSVQVARFKTCLIYDILIYFLPNILLIAFYTIEVRNSRHNYVDAIEAFFSKLFVYPSRNLRLVLTEDCEVIRIWLQRIYLGL